MTHPVAYTFLGFHFNSLVDNGEILNLEETHQKIRSKSLFPWLKSKFGNSIDISLFSDREIEDIEEFFESLSFATDERRKMGIQKNGLCLLVAYCFEAAQRKQNELR
jgi:hypothetical protein